MVRPYEPLYTVKEAAKVLKMNTESVYALIKQNQLPGLKLGSTKIRGSDLEQFIEKYPVMEGGQADGRVNDHQPPPERRDLTAPS